MGKIECGALVAWVMFAAGCVSISDKRADPGEVWRQTAVEYALRESSIKLSPRRFNQSFGGYTVSDAYTSLGKDVDTQQVSASSETVTVESSVIDWLIFDSPYPHDYSYRRENRVYQIQTRQDFGFDLRGEGLIQVICGTFTLSETETETNGTYRASVHEADATRLSTFLSCKLSQAGTSVATAAGAIGTFSAEVRPDGHFKAEFSGLLEPFSVIPLTRFTQRSRDGGEFASEQLPPWMQRTAGFAVEFGGKRAAAISLIGDPLLWLDLARSEDMDVAAGLAYALHMFNDLDRDWSKRQL